MIHTVKGFGVVNKAEVDVFLELSRFFYDPTNVGNLISGLSAFSKFSLNIWKFSVHVLLKPDLEEMATHSRTLAWKIPWTEEPGSYSPWGHKESDMIVQLHSHSLTDCCSFIVRLEIRWNKSSNLFFLFKIVLAILGFHCILISKKKQLRC